MNNKHKSLALVLPITAAACFAALSYAPPAKAARPTSAAISSAIAPAGTWEAVLKYIIGPISRPVIVGPVTKPVPTRSATQAVENAASRIYR